MSKLCKIESPISLHLMSLNFVREKKKMKGGKQQADERHTHTHTHTEREDKSKSSALFWGSLHNIRVGVSVCEHLQNVCVGAQLWVSECG